MKKTAPKITFEAYRDTIDCLRYWLHNSEIVERERMEKHDVILFDMMMNPQKQIIAN